MDSPALLQLEGVTKHFPVGGGLRGPRLWVRAVEDLSLSIAPGETYALVGESGSGKTTVARLALLLEAPTRGVVRFEGKNLARLTTAEHRAYRRQVQAVFQDPYASLNPRLKVGAIVSEPMLAHHTARGAELKRKVGELLELVGLPPAAAQLYPHEFSGGQRQRIAIARALALRPRLLVLDEPVSALDVSIRAQILNLLADIQEEFGLTYLVIAHDLALVEHFSSRVGVMYLGSVVETGATAEVFRAARHPYTQALLASVPRPDPDQHIPEGMILGDVGSALAPPPGCKFHPRCPRAVARCATEVPLTRAVATGHQAACHLLAE